MQAISAVWDACENFKREKKKSFGSFFVDWRKFREYASETINFDKYWRLIKN